MLVKCKIKEYPDGTKKYYVYSDSYYKDTDFNENKKLGGSAKEWRTPEMIEQDKKHSEHMNLVRTRNKIKDYCLSNDFDMFWTLTFGTERDSDERCFQRMNDWLKNRKKKYGRFDYIFIPERHKDGCIHFHGVTGGFKGKMVDSGVRDKGHIVYNCSDWRFGFSTITKVRSRKKTASYITKYVTKQLSQDIVGKGKKKYWSSQGLRLPVERLLDYDPFSGVQPDWESDNVKIYNVPVESSKL